MVSSIYSDHTIYQALLLAVLKRDKYRCRYCNCALSKFYATLDHVIPRSKGGPDLFTNLAACCPDCNYAKDDKSAVQFLFEKGLSGPAIRQWLATQKQLSRMTIREQAEYFS